jgi:arylsulfatase A
MGSPISANVSSTIWILGRVPCSKAWSCLAICFLAGVSNASTADEAHPPNIILILADDLGRECLGCYGGNSYQTPNLDRMAAEGMRFETCYATPLCATTRDLLLSGQYNFRSYRDWDEMDFERSTFAHDLKKAGYVTAAVGKWHRGGWDRSPKGPRAAGFDRYCSFNYPEMFELQKEGRGGNCFWWTHLWQDDRPVEVKDRGTSDYLNDYAAQFIRDHREKPFFLYYAMNLVHRPFVATPDHIDTEDFEQRTAKRGRVESFASMVSYLDTLVGRTLDVLKAEGLDDNTIVIFTSDNGTDNGAEASTLRSKFRDREVGGGKYYPTELGANIPFLVRWPGVTKGGTVAPALTDFSDLRPTFCQLAGLPRPDDLRLDGQSLVPVLRGESDTHRPWIYTYGNYDRSSKKYKRPHQYPKGFTHYLRDARWKYGSDGCLFDLAADPFEEKPISGELEGDAAKARKRLADALRKLRNSQPRRW